VLERANEKFEFPVQWGVDLQSEHERYLTEKYAKKPVIVMNYPKAIKAFYMRVNDDRRTIAAMDVLALWIGEITRQRPAVSPVRSARAPGDCSSPPTVAAPLHVQPEIGAVAEDAREDQRGRRRHVPAFLTISGQLNIEAYRRALTKVYTLWTDVPHRELEHHGAATVKSLAVGGLSWGRSRTA
jgi:aspartyl/asparaginyl-tRNA synthetase